MVWIKEQKLKGFVYNYPTNATRQRSNNSVQYRAEEV